jgi:hypothetical protein
VNSQGFLCEWKVFLKYVKGCTRLDKIRNELGVFSVNDRIRRYRQDWLEHVERMEGGTSAETGSLVQAQRKKRTW